MSWATRLYRITTASTGAYNIYRWVLFNPALSSFQFNHFQFNHFQFNHFQFNHFEAFNLITGWIMMTSDISRCALHVRKCDCYWFLIFWVTYSCGFNYIYSFKHNVYCDYCQTSPAQSYWASYYVDYYSNWYTHYYTGWFMPESLPEEEEKEGDAKKENKF